ncbi:MAG: methyltransferase domain-containing protein [Terracidiphilus sp.]
MPPEVLDFSKRAELTELMDAPCSREVMQACLRDLSKVNRWFLGYRPTLNWLESLALQQFHSPVRILDVGCGYGDTLRRIETWATGKKIHMMLTACDLNPDTMAIAAQATAKTSAIEWVAADVFSYRNTEPIDVVVSSLFTHHLIESDIVRFLQWMEKHARVGWFINDLSRAQIPYHLFKAFSMLVGLHPFVQHDGPASFARAFVPEDWQNMCAAAGLPMDEIVIEGFTPARLCVGRKKPKQ